jgi:D-sedoheptulose 7-phosphate isomerase
MAMKKKIKDHLNLTATILNSLDTNSIVELAAKMQACWNRKGIIYTCGNGGSASTAAHFTGDIVKGLSTGKQTRFKSICVSDNVTAFSALANDLSYDEVFVEPLTTFLTSNDMLITFSGSGNSVNIIKAIEYANSINAISVAICGFDGGKAKQIARHHIHAQVNDMEVAENVHVVIMHALKLCFMTTK